MKHILGTIIKPRPSGLPGPKGDPNTLILSNECSIKLTPKE